jgi:hypothetical protein
MERLPQPRTAALEATVFCLRCDFSADIFGNDCQARSRSPPVSRQDYLNPQPTRNIQAFARETAIIDINVNHQQLLKGELNAIRHRGEGKFGKHRTPLR